MPVEVPPHGDSHVVRVGELCSPRTGRWSGTGQAARPGTSGAIAYELNDETEFVLAQEGFDCADDPGLAVDFQPVAHLERLVTHEVPGRDDLVAAAKLIAIVDAGQDGQDDMRAARQLGSRRLTHRRRFWVRDVCSRT